MSTKPDNKRLTVQVNDAAEEIRRLKHGIDSLKSSHQRLGNETIDSENQLRTTISQLITILNAFAIEDERVSRQWKIIKWTKLPQIRQGSVKRIQKDIQNAIRELGTVGQVARCTISQAQHFQEDTADLYSNISQKTEESRKMMIAIEAASTITRTRCNQLEKDIRRCDGEIASSKEHRDQCKDDGDYYDKKSDSYRTAGKVLLFVPGVNLFASPFCYYRKHRNSEKTCEQFQQVLDWQSQASRHRSEHQSLKAEISELEEASEVLQKTQGLSIAMEKRVSELEQASLKLVDEYQKISDSSFEVARCAKLLQSQVVGPMDHARALVYESYRQQALQSTQKIIEVLEKSRVWSDGQDKLRLAQAPLEGDQKPLANLKLS
ncbi:hypothetical protein MMC29_003147 [Sticta canariensis]|nr:hypothetical protein [Sticta canariensis]